MALSACRFPALQECMTGEGERGNVEEKAPEFYRRIRAGFGGSSRLAHDGHIGSFDGIFRVERAVCLGLMIGNSAAKIGPPREAFHGETTEAWLKRLVSYGVWLTARRYDDLKGRCGKARPSAAPR